MASPQQVQVGQGVSTNASGLLRTGQGCVQKIICAASSSGTITIYDNTSAAGTVLLNAFPVVAGNVYDVGLMFQLGCYIAIGGTATITPTLGP